MFKVKFADIGEGLTEGKVTEVLVKLGDSVKMGDALFFVETDKVNSEIPAPIDGIVAKILVAADQEIKVGDVVFEIEDGKDHPEESAKEEENASVVGSTPVSNDLIPSRGAKTPTNITSTDSSNKYDVIVIGGGIGGYISAIKNAQLGHKTLIIEKEWFGGVCLNVGCIPTKALLKTAKVYHTIFKDAKTFGIDTSGITPNIDWNKAMERKNKVVNQLTSGVRFLMKKNKIDIIDGEAKAIDKNTIEVLGKQYKTENLIIATGSIPNALPLPGFDEGRKQGTVINSTGALELKEIPKTMVIIGGGVIGVEFANVYANLGTKVTILQGLNTILEMLDADITKVMVDELVKSGVDIITNVKISKFENKEIFFELDGKTQSIKTDFVLESVGRKVVNTGFTNIGLDINERGSILVNDYCETNIEGVYAIGDVTGKSMLAHVASHAGVTAANRIGVKRNSAHAHDMKMNYDQIPSCIYTHPEASMIGKTEEQIKALGIEYKVFKFPFAAVGKALADNETVGFVKLIAEPKYGQLLGAHIVGQGATEMITEIGLAMASESTVYEIANTIHPHPTMNEAIGEAAEGIIFGKALNF